MWELELADPTNKVMKSRNQNLLGRFAGVEVRQRQENMLSNDLKMSRGINSTDDLGEFEGVANEAFSKRARTQPRDMEVH
eukprot:11323302-Alexandrium_andersonii.AAC.1